MAIWNLQIKTLYTLEQSDNEIKTGYNIGNGNSDTISDSFSYVIRNKW